MTHKVLYVSEAPIYGGAERYLVNIAEGIDRNAFDITMLLSDQAPQRLINDLEQLQVPCVKQSPIRGKGDLKGIWAHIQTFKKMRPDIVHFNLSNPLHGQYAMLSARLAHVPVCVATMHLPPRQTTTTRRGRFFERQTICRLNTLIAVCNASRQLMIEHFGIRPERTAYVYNGINTAEFDNQAQQPLATVHQTKSLLHIGTAGRLSPQKGYDILIQSIAQLVKTAPDIQVSIAGEGPQLDDLKKLSHHMHISKHIHFLGMRQDIPAFLKTLDIFVLPSRYESFSITLLEAMAAGLPIVTTAVDGAPEALTHEKHGLLIPPENPQALTEALLSLIADPQKRIRFGAAARLRVQTEFSLLQMVHATQEIYRMHLSKLPCAS